MTPEEVSATLARWAAGDAGALEPLLEHHRGRLVAFTRSRLPAGAPGQDAEDVVQDACACVLRKVRELAVRRALRWDNGDAFFAWLVMFVVNTLRDRRKYALAARRAGTPETPGADSETPSRAAVRCEQESLLHAAIRAALSDEERTAVELFHLQGLTAQETAARMNCTPGTVRTLCWRARQHLRQALGASSQFFTTRGGN
jgi:RNA polymerase sigma-70 factor (ECF subfamily)